jgi:hypothetical protein
LNASTPILGRLIVEGSLIVNNTSVNLTAVYIEIKGGSLIIASTDKDGNVIGSFQKQCSITILGTNDKLSSIHGPNPRSTPTFQLGSERVTHAPGVIAVFGKFIALGKSQRYSWLPLAEPALAGNSSVLLDGAVDWLPGSEIVITCTDFDQHEAEVREIKSIHVLQKKTLIVLSSALDFSHFSEDVVQYGTKRMRMQGKVGLLTRNIVIRGSGEGEQSPYTTWNLPGSDGPSTCGNMKCDTGETSLSCPSDCFGPMYEYGASILVSSYSEKFILCTKDRACTGEYSRSFSGSLNISNIEVKYYGQNNLRNGLVFLKLADSGKNSIVQNISLNRGYFGAVLIDQSSFVSFTNSLFYRAFLPCVDIQSGWKNSISGVLGVIGIYWNNHRGAKQVSSPFMIESYKILIESIARSSRRCKTANLLR